MKCTKSLYRIEPYNDLYFKSCFYNSMFSVINYYNKSIIPFLINSVPIYIYDCIEEERFSLEYMDTFSREELLAKMDIVVFSKQNNTNIVEDIIDSINQNKPIIVNIDCFYMPIRTEYYLKSHWEHSILIYGYDNIKQIFNIIEQKYVDSLTYNKIELKYNDLINAYKGFLNLSAKNLKRDSYREYGLNQNDDLINNDSNEYINIFRQNIYNNCEDINKGLQSLENFLLDFEAIFMDEMALRKNANNLISGLNIIINGKKVEKYKLEKLFSKEHALSNLVLEIENNWNSIRYTLVKYMFSSLYNQQNFEKLKSKLITIKETENSYYDLICKL